MVLAIAWHLRTASIPRLTGTQGAAALVHHFALRVHRAGGRGSPPPPSPGGAALMPGASSPDIVHQPAAPSLGARGHRQGWRPCCTFLSQRGCDPGWVLALCLGVDRPGEAAL